MRNLPRFLTLALAFLTLAFPALADDKEMAQFENRLRHKLLQDGQLDLPGHGTIWVRGLTKNVLMHPLIVFRSPKGAILSVHNAKEAEFRVDLQNKKLLLDMKEVNFVTKEVTGYVLCELWPLSLPAVDALALLEKDPLDRKIRKCFGDDCPELRMSIKVHLPTRGILLAADLIEPLPNGQVKLTPCSIARFGKEKKHDLSPVVTTVRSGYALLKLDGPFTGAAELGNRRILSVEMANGVRLEFEPPETP